ncbi:MAG: hypothetical protein PUB55_00210 [Bacteroidales bacterium]|nr:hypothetical protein [Bacteroidales bacterium]
MDWLFAIFAWILVLALGIGLIVFSIQVMIMFRKIAKGEIMFINPAFPWRGAIEVKRKKREPEDDNVSQPKKRPEWLRFLLEETPATLYERYRRNRQSEK